jgi:pseudo-rSAM protein/SPASM domain protein
VISVSKLLCGAVAAGDGLRYGDPPAGGDAPEQIRERRQQRPVVVWNTTRGCNLSCRHCYASAETERAPGELSTAEGRQLLAELADYGVPVVLFSGGEPLVRDDLEELVAHASDVGLRPVLSTNGTLLTPERVRTLRDAGLAYAGVSVDGLPERHDRFRGQEGSFEAAVRGIEACLDAGVKTGLRYTVTEDTVEDLTAVVEMLVERGLDRFCFYHLAPGGRGGDIVESDLSPADRRAAVRTVCDLTREYHDRGVEVETLLVGNYCDAAYLVEYARRELGDAAARRVREYLNANGGDPAGERVADIDPLGNVHPTQFWQGYSPGNVRDRPFGAIWEDESNPVLSALRDRPEGLAGRCRDCGYADVCRGGSRLQALAAHGDLFAPDPRCYLHPEERTGETGTGAGSAD